MPSFRCVFAALLAALFLATIAAESPAFAEEEARLTEVALESGEIWNWLPQKIGNSWTYDVVFDRKISNMGQTTDRDHITGRVDFVIAAESLLFDSKAEVYQTLAAYRLNQGDNSGVFATSRYFGVDEEGLFEFGYKGIDADEDDDSKVEKYDKPRLMIPRLLRPGKTWNVGVLYMRSAEGTFFADTTAKIIGYSDVESDAGTFTDCLVITYRGRIAGHVTYRGRKVSRSGSTQSTEWYASGVGMVKRETKTLLSWSAGSSPVRSEEKETMILKKYDISEGAVMAWR